jgi:hypothetical protein
MFAAGHAACAPCRRQREESAEEDQEQVNSLLRALGSGGSIRFGRLFYGCPAFLCGGDDRGAPFRTQFSPLPLSNRRWRHILASSRSAWSAAAQQASHLGDLVFQPPSLGLQSF